MRMSHLLSPQMKRKQQIQIFLNVLTVESVWHSGVWSLILTPLLPPSPPPLQNAWHFILMNHYLNLLHQGSEGHGSHGEPDDRGDHDDDDAVGQATGILWRISCQFGRRDARWCNEAPWTCWDWGMNHSWWPDSSGSVCVCVFGA